MGANFQTVTVPRNKLTDKQVHEWFRDYQEQLTYEYGHDAYNGTMSNSRGLNIDSTRLFKDSEEAHEYIIDKTDKWGSALAVRVFIPAKEFKDTVRGKAIWEMLMGARKKESEFSHAELMKHNHKVWEMPEYVLMKKNASDWNAVFQKEIKKYFDKQYRAKTKRPKHFFYVIGAWCAE